MLAKYSPPDPGLRPKTAQTQIHVTQTHRDSQNRTVRTEFVLEMLRAWRHS